MFIDLHIAGLVNYNQENLLLVKSVNLPLVDRVITIYI